MTNDPLGGALAKSLHDENAAVDERFERAERVLGGQGTGRPARHAKRPAQKKVPVVRDTFSFPEFDYALLSQLQQRCLDGGHNASKSELVRAGLKALAQMKDAHLLKAARAVEKLKPGRGRGSSL
jgi:hypothetical protein